MTENLIGYQEDPLNGDGIIRARTNISLRSWEFSRDLSILNTINLEFNESAFPGIYILRHNTKVYVGESSNIFNRLTSHFSNPPNARVTNFNNIVIMSDGRTANQSVLNDQVIRLELEFYINQLLTINHFVVTSQANSQETNPFQTNIVALLKNEINVLLSKRAWISKFLPDEEVREVLPDQLNKILHGMGYDVSTDSSISKNKALLVDGVATFVRPGSDKSKGWQITFRSKFFEFLQRGEGNLLINRDGILIIPLSTINEFINDFDTSDNDTRDVFATFENGSVFLKYHDQVLDVTEFRLINPS